MIEDTRFQRDVARMLLTFSVVVATDLIVMSLFTQRLRFWFPVWLDPHWATRPDPWVVYSQSYAAGIFMVPLLWRAVDRGFLLGTGSLRGIYWGAGVAVFGFIAWWKGGLMIEHRKHVEALGWFFLTAIVWSSLRVAEALPSRLASLTRRRLLGGLLLGVACFFLGMSVLDPIVQLGVQRIGWSTGLAIEVSFFVPAGCALLWIARNLRGAP